MDHEELARKAPELEDAARQIGLYMDEAAVMGDENQVALVARFSIGKIAFSDRVQHPEKYTVDRELAQMEIGVAKDEFLDARTKIAEAIARGEDPFAEDEPAE